MSPYVHHLAAGGIQSMDVVETLSLRKRFKLALPASFGGRRHLVYGRSGNAVTTQAYYATWALQVGASCVF